MKVRVLLPVQIAVPYIVEVPDLNIENIKKTLLTKTASDWEIDPDFYENFGSNFPYFVAKLSIADVEIVIEKPPRVLRERVVEQLRDELGREPTESEIQTSLQSIDEGMG